MKETFFGTLTIAFFYRFFRCSFCVQNIFIRKAHTCFNRIKRRKKTSSSFRGIQCFFFVSFFFHFFIFEMCPSKNRYFPLSVSSLSTLYEEEFCVMDLSTIHIFNISCSSEMVDWAIGNAYYTKAQHRIITSNNRNIMWSIDESYFDFMLKIIRINSIPLWHWL